MITYWDWPTVFMYNVALLGVVLLYSLANTAKGKFIDSNELEVTVKDHKKFSLAVVFIMLSPLLIILFIRDFSIGGDVKNYLNTYRNLEHTNFSLQYLFDIVTSQEPLYILFGVIIGKLSNWNERAYVIFYAVVPWYFFIKAMNRESTENSLLISLMFAICFFYIKSFSMLRQILAMSIILYAMTYIKENNWKKYISLTLVAVGFHYTAIIALPIYIFTAKSKLGKVYRGVILAGFMLLFAVGPEILSFIANLMGTKYSEISSNARGFGIGNFISQLPMTLIVLYFYKKITKNYPDAKVYLNIYLLTIIIIQFKYLNPLFERFVLYTQMTLIFILPQIFNVLKKETNTIITKMTYGVCFFIYFNYVLYYYTIINPYYIMPYKWMY